MSSILSQYASPPARVKPESRPRYGSLFASTPALFLTKLDTPGVVEPRTLCLAAPFYKALQETLYTSERGTAFIEAAHASYANLSAVFNTQTAFSVYSKSSSGMRNASPTATDFFEMVERIIRSFDQPVLAGSIRSRDGHGTCTISLTVLYAFNHPI